MKTIYMSNVMSYYFINCVTIIRSSIALKAYHDGYSAFVQVALEPYSY